MRVCRDGAAQLLCQAETLPPTHILPFPRSLPPLPPLPPAPSPGAQHVAPAPRPAPSTTTTAALPLPWSLLPGAPLQEPHRRNSPPMDGSSLDSTSTHHATHKVTGDSVLSPALLLPLLLLSPLPPQPPLPLPLVLLVLALLLTSLPSMGRPRHHAKNATPHTANSGDCVYLLNLVCKQPYGRTAGQGRGNQSRAREGFVGWLVGRQPHTGAECPFPGRAQRGTRGGAAGCWHAQGAAGHVRVVCMHARARV